MSADTTPPPPRHKELLDEWISNNYEEYCDFTEMMHSVDGIGFERVFNFASKLAPGFKKAVILRMKDDRATDFKNLEEMLHEAKIGNKLLAGFENPLPDSMTTPMLAWLFRGRSFECMVELGEELIRNGKMSFLRRMAAKLLIKGIINTSISIDARTEDDWRQFCEEQDDLGVVPTVTLKIVSKFKSAPTPAETENSETAEKKKPKMRTAERKPLKELLTEDYLLELIEERVTVKKRAKDIAMLYIALDKAHVLHSCTIVEFHSALDEAFGEKAGYKKIHVRGVQDAHRTFMSRVQNRLVIDFPENKAELADIRDFLDLPAYAAV